MLLNNEDGRATIAARAGKGFDKAHIKNIILADFRFISPNIDIREYDYFFEYNGKPYRINQRLFLNPKKDLIVSEKYELIEL